VTTARYTYYFRVEDTYFMHDGDSYGEEGSDRTIP